MTTAYDFKVTDEGDLYIDPVKMDFVIAPSDPQHIKELMLGVPGWIKEFPIVGFNPYSKINTRINRQATITEATKTLINDGYVKGPQGISFDLTPEGEFVEQIFDVYRP